MILRAARSPVPPKITRAQGCGVRASRAPARSGFASGGAIVLNLGPAARERSGLVDSLVAAKLLLAPSFRFHLVPAELVAQGRRDLHRVAVRLARGEAREQRVRERGHRDVVGDGFEDRPAALAGIRDVALDVLEVAALGLERALRELEEPGAHDAALVPDLRDLLQVEIELARVEQLEALAVGLHHPVLDAVVD